MPHNEKKSNLPQRKLTTILAADVVGYSRMMGADEDGTHVLLGKCRKIIDRNIEHYSGRIFNTAGDSVMAEFGSTVEAVRCALEIQEEIVAHNTDKPESEKMWFRIGLNVGDVIIEGDDLIGDGVNIASRMESIAPPGGICISGSVHELVRNKLSFAFEDMGAQSVKNIVEPVPAYSLLPAATPQITPGMAANVPPRSEKKRRKGFSIGVAVVLVLAAAIAVTYFARMDAGKDLSLIQQDASPSPVSAPGSSVLEEPVVTGQMGAEKPEVVQEPTAAAPVLSSKPPSYFAARTVEGVSMKTGERFVIEMTERGSVIVTIYKNEEPTVPRTSDSGRWWINNKDRVCFEFKKFKKGEKFCLIHAVEEGSEWLVSGDPTKPKWELRPR